MKALIVVDVQNDFCNVNGALSNKETIEVVPKIAALVEQFRLNDDTIIYTRDTHDISYLLSQEGRNLPIKHCMYGSWGWKNVNEVDTAEIPNKNIMHINKNTFGYDCWEDEELDMYEEVIVCGVMTDICVISNVVNIKTNYPDLPIIVIADCCAGTTPERHVAAIEVMKSLQVEIR